MGTKKFRTGVAERSRAAVMNPGNRQDESALRRGRQTRTKQENQEYYQNGSKWKFPRGAEMRTLTGRLRELLSDDYIPYDYAQDCADWVEECGVAALAILEAAKKLISTGWVILSNWQRRILKKM